MALGAAWVSPAQAQAWPTHPVKIVVPAPAGSRSVVVLGAAAHFFSPGDIVIVMNFGYFTPEEIKTHKPRILLCDEQNNFSLQS